jgi:hypothetical protein
MCTLNKHEKSKSRQKNNKVVYSETNHNSMKGVI